jgi:hypothetical protein
MLIQNQWNNEQEPCARDLHRGRANNIMLRRIDPSETLNHPITGG